MCSVAGSAKLVEVEGMLDKMRHRAPDGDTSLVGYPYSLGMGRLAIIDLKSDNLILYNEDEFYLSYNGEIYNYIEIRNELKKLGWHFTTDSDTEVLLKAWRQWDIKMFPKLNGMFAFAIYDTKKGKIILARDIAGEKPLYFTNGPFRFASEAKALGFRCEEFPPASYMIYNVSRQILYPPKFYWTLKPIKISNDPVSELDELIADSIRLRTRSDVPYGLYFSKGVDSTLISTYHDFKHKFTYKDKDYEEEFKKIFPKILWHLDYPVHSFSPFGLWKLAEQASRKVKVVISGEGADELFGGYIRYILPHFNWTAQAVYPSYRTMFEPAENVSDAGWEEFNGNMRELLRMQDRMSSAFGMENRCIFLDRRIIEFAFSLRSDLKIHGLETKIVLNKILKKRMPNYKPIEKAGLYTSVNDWIHSKQIYEKSDWMLYQNTLWQKLSQ